MILNIAKGTLGFMAALAILGVGTIANAAAPMPELKVYGQLPAFDMAAISPSGDHVAILATVDGKRAVVMLDAAMKPLQMIPVGTMKVRRIEWAGDLAVLIHYSATVGLGIGFTTDKAELMTVVVAPLDGSPPWQVFQKDTGIAGGVRGNFGVIQRDGRWYGYYGGFTLERSTGTGEMVLPNGHLRTDLYEVDLQTHKSKLIARGIDSDDTDREWMVDGQGAVGAEIDIAAKSGEWTIRDGRAKVLASGKDPLGRVGLIGFTPDGSGVVWSQHKDGVDGHQWFSVPLAGGAAPQPYLEDAEIDEIFLDSGHRLIGYRADNAAKDSHFFALRHDKIFKASQRAFPNRRMSLADNSASFERLIVETEGPGDPGTWWLVDIKTGNAEILGSSYTVAPAQVGPMHMLPYVAADGLKMEGVLTLPPGREARALPAVVLPHGGPRYHDVAGFDWMAQALVSRGYAVFQPNFRGSTGYGNNFVAAGDGEWGRKMQSDISDGLAELAKQGIVDPKRVCIMGASYGGYAALAGVTLQQGLYRCAVSIAGLSDLARMVRTDIDQSGSDPMLTRILRVMVGQGRDLKAVSPIRFVDKVSVPVLLIHGKDDTVVEYEQSQLMADALKRAGKPVKFVTLPHEDHWLSGSDTRQAMLEASVEFIVTNNPPDPAP